MSKAKAAGFEVEFFTTALTPEQTAEVDRQLTPDAIAELLAEHKKGDIMASPCRREFPQS